MDVLETLAIVYNLAAVGFGVAFYVLCCVGIAIEWVRGDLF